MSCTEKPTTKRNAPDVRDIVGTAVLAIVCGFTRYVHINRLRNDTALAALLGLGRIVCEDSVRRALKSADGRELDAWLVRHEKDVFDRLLSFRYVIDIGECRAMTDASIMVLGLPWRWGRKILKFHLVAK